MKRPVCGNPLGGPSWRSRRDWHGNARAGRARFFRRIAAVVLLMVLLGSWGLVSLGWLAAGKLFGLSSSSAIVWVPIGTLVVTFIAAIVFLRIVRGLGMPLGNVMEAADRVAGGDYSVRVAEHGPPPIRRLASSFNQMTERLGKSEQQRRNLMADVAHELRTPLSVVQGKLEGLLDGVYSRDDVQLEEILSEVQVLSRLIEDLRTLTLSEAGVLKLEKEFTDVRDLIQTVGRAFATEASMRQIALKVDLPASLPALVIDAVRIRQVLNNLLSNALRHTPPGGLIETSAGTSAGTVDSKSIWIQVRDTGGGMTQTETERAFERFQKGAESRGSGLGLTIARNLVVAHGGTIQAASQPGLGTTIKLTLPVEAQE
jgi:signal transduction histidine kinase